MAGSALSRTTQTVDGPPPFGEKVGAIGGVVNFGRLARKRQAALRNGLTQTSDAIGRRHREPAQALPPRGPAACVLQASRLNADLCCHGPSQRTLTRHPDHRLRVPSDGPRPRLSKRRIPETRRPFRRTYGLRSARANVHGQFSDRCVHSWQHARRSKRESMR